MGFNEDFVKEMRNLVGASDIAFEYDWKLLYLQTVRYYLIIKAVEYIMSIIHKLRGSRRKEYNIKRYQKY